MKKAAFALRHLRLLSARPSSQTWEVHGQEVSEPEAVLDDVCAGSDGTDTKSDEAGWN